MSIGLDIPRTDGLDKLSGRVRYVDDLVVEGVLHGATIRSPIARGKIRRIHFDPAINWREFALVDHHDIPGPNVVKLIEPDQPALAAGEFRHKHEPILLLAHRSIHKLREAVHSIRIDVDPWPAVLDPRPPITPNRAQYRDDNVFKRIDIRKGDPSSVFAKAAHVVEGIYHTGSQEHVYLETQGMLAFREDKRLAVQGSMQCPYYVVDALTHLFQRPREAFRVVQTPVGGGFGGKEEYPSLIAIHAALLAEKANAPVKIIYDRQEDMAVTTKRHPSWVRHRTALDREGRLLAMEIQVLLDGGAYVTLSPVVLSRGCIHAAGPYHCEHIHIHGEARFTNSPPYGAFRGFGAPQTLFAVERHMDVIAKQLALDPVELRRRNLIREGQSLATGQIVKEKIDLPSLMDHALREAEYEKKRAEHAEFNRSQPYLRRGIGLSTFLHGSGFTGSGEAYLASEVYVDGLPDGRVEVLTAQTDMGQGTTTILAQVAANRLGLPADQVIVAQPDTSRVPNSGPTVASRTAMIVGQLIEDACDHLINRVLYGHGIDKEVDRQVGQQVGRGRRPDAPDLQDAIRRWHIEHPNQHLRGFGKYRKPESIRWDDKEYRGDAYAAYSWAADVAEVEVDLRTYQTRVLDFVAVQEVGRVINPTLATGQVQGGVVQGIGWALYEDVALEDGVMKNCQMTNYVIPASSDMPPIRVLFEENPSVHGPGGAKGIGEMPIDGPAPAVINAVCNAVGASIHEIPLTPEKLMTIVENEHGKV